MTFLWIRNSTYMTGCYEGRWKPSSDLQFDKGSWRQYASSSSGAANSAGMLSSSRTHKQWTTPWVYHSLNLFIQWSPSPPGPRKSPRDSTVPAPSTTGKSILTSWHGQWRAACSWQEGLPQGFAFLKQCLIWRDKNAVWESGRETEHCLFSEKVLGTHKHPFLTMLGYEV